MWGPFHIINSRGRLTTWDDDNASWEKELGYPMWEHCESSVICRNGTVIINNVWSIVFNYSCHMVYWEFGLLLY